MEFALTLGFKDNPNVPKVLAAVDEFKAILEEANPAGKEKFLSRLDDIARLATLRNTFTRIPDGAECNRLVLAALVADDLPDAPSRQLVCDLLDLAFGMLQGGLPAVGRDPDTGFIAAFAQFPCATLVAAEFPDAFDKFATFATALSDRLEAERAGVSPGASPATESPAPPFGANGILPV